MAHWYSVYHDEDYEAEIQVGLYEQWLQQLDIGPTQADRVLEHTPVMEIANERRFAVCQDGIDISSFEAEHTRRIKKALDHVQERLASHASRETCEAEGCLDEALIGLIHFPTQDMPKDCSQFAGCPHSPRIILVQHELDSMLHDARQNSRKRPRTSEEEEEEEVPAESSGEEDYVRYQAEVYEGLVTARKKARASPTAGALQLRPIRCRRALHPTTKDSCKGKSRADLPTSS